MSIVSARGSSIVGNKRGETAFMAQDRDSKKVGCYEIFKP
jgi:hypothetical protein